MRRWIPDWLIYVAVFSALVYLLFTVDEQADAPPAPPVEAEAPAGPLLPPPSDFDPEVLVEVGPVASGIGTAFAIDRTGWWMTARHVVGDCARVGIVVGRGAAVEVTDVRVALFADLALLRTQRAPQSLAFELSEEELRVGQTAYHVGFPQGRPGEAASRLIGRERLIARGRYSSEEPVLAWAEVGRTDGLFGTLSGMSGGPVFDGEGRVIGVTVAESARRGRIYTAAPSSLVQFLDVNDVEPRGAPARGFDLTSYGLEADRLRRDLAVAQVICVADQP